MIAETKQNVKRKVSDTHTITAAKSMQVHAMIQHSLYGFAGLDFLESLNMSHTCPHVVSRVEHSPGVTNTALEDVWRKPDGRYDS